MNRIKIMVARMFTVSLKDEERFYLRLLLLHVRGATSFEFLRTFDGILYPTFKAAAAQRGLLNSDEEWDRCLTEAVIFQMPKQIRDTFSYICCFCQPAAPLDLWTKFAGNWIVFFKIILWLIITINLQMTCL